jgi:hypothetical protein
MRERLPDVVTLSQAFIQAGYRAERSSKVFHHPDPSSWHDYHPSKLAPIPDEPRPR